MSERPVKTYPTLGCCGLDCGLCPRYYTVGDSRCPGCCGPGFFDKHPSCGCITCCVKKRKLEVCAQCGEFPCSRFKAPEEYQNLDSPSYPPYRKVMPNMEFIRGHGIEEFMKRQSRRIGLLEIMLRDFDDGRSKSFICACAALLSVKGLEAGLKEAEEIVKGGIVSDDTKARAKTLRGILDDVAAREGIELRLRKK